MLTDALQAPSSHPSPKKFFSRWTPTGLTCLLALTLAFSLAAQPDNPETSLDPFFTPQNIGVLHVYAPPQTKAHRNYFFYGTEIPKGYYHYFSSNWRSELPQDFTVYGVFKVRIGGEDEYAYLLRFSGGGRNLLALFSWDDDRLLHRRTLATRYCTDMYCVQLDSWLTDFDGDARHDILQKVRMNQFTLMGEPVDNYIQQLRQNEEGAFVEAPYLDIDLDRYNFETAGPEGD
jgi:hypothetical protein